MITIKGYKMDLLITSFQMGFGFLGSLLAIFVVGIWALMLVNKSFEYFFYTPEYIAKRDAWYEKEFKD